MPRRKQIYHLDGRSTPASAYGAVRLNPDPAPTPEYWTFKWKPKAKKSEADERENNGITTLSMYMGPRNSILTPDASPSLRELPVCKHETHQTQDLAKRKIKVTSKRAHTWKLFVTDPKPNTSSNLWSAGTTKSVNTDSSALSRAASLPHLAQRPTSGSSFKTSFAKMTESKKNRFSNGFSGASPLEHRNKAMAKKLHEYGSNPLAMLVQYLHPEQGKESKVVMFDEYELELARSLDHAVDFDQFFAAYQGARTSSPTHWQDTASEKAEEARVESDWKKIEQAAEEFINRISGSQLAASSLRKRQLFLLAPHPDTGWDRVWQAGHTLPLRKWTSELFLQSRSSSTLLSAETRSNLKWNASLEDVRHLIGTTLELDQASKPTIRFRRLSFGNHVWQTRQLNEGRATDYKKRLQNSSDCEHPAEGQPIMFQVPVRRFSRLKSRFMCEPACLDNLCIDGEQGSKIGQEITWIVRDLMLAVNAQEIVRLLLRPHSVSPDSCPHITALLGFQKRIIQLCASYILKEKTCSGRAGRISLFIEVAEELNALSNWQSLYSIIACLQSPPIARLSKTWDRLSQLYRDHYNEFFTLSEKAYDHNSHKPTNNEEPCIPFFDEMVNTIKRKCAEKLSELRRREPECKSRHPPWPSPNQLAEWVNEEVREVEEKALQGANRKEDSSLIRKIKKNLKSVHFHPSSSSGSNMPTSNSMLNMHPHHDASKDQLRRVASAPKDLHSVCKFASARKSTSRERSSLSSVWSISDIQKLGELEEREILHEMARTLDKWQAHARLYSFAEHDEGIRDFILLYPYESMEHSMRRSLDLEPPSPRQQSSQSPLNTQ